MATKKAKSSHSKRSERLRSLSNSSKSLSLISMLLLFHMQPSLIRDGLLTANLRASTATLTGMISMMSGAKYKTH